ASLKRLPPTRHPVRPSLRPGRIPDPSKHLHCSRNRATTIHVARNLLNGRRYSVSAAEHDRACAMNAQTASLEAPPRRGTRQPLGLAVALWNGRGRCAFSLDSSGTHSYTKQAFKFRQARSQEDGVLDDRYFDIVVEYANTSPEDLLVQITASNRGATPAV